MPHKRTEFPLRVRYLNRPTTDTSRTVRVGSTERLKNDRIKNPISPTPNCPTRITSRADAGGALTGGARRKAGGGGRELQVVGFVMWVRQWGFVIYVGSLCGFAGGGLFCPSPRIGTGSCVTRTPGLQCARPGVCVPAPPGVFEPVN